MRKQLKNFIRKGVYKLIKPPVTKIRNSNSQAGEDMILRFLFDSMGLKKISYIDIGANDPIIGNNTYAFSGRGNIGILVEPDLSYLQQIKKLRPDVKVLQAAVSETNGEADFYVFDEPQLNTLSKEEASKRQQTGRYKLRETRKIALITIEKIIQQYLNNQTPHLISLDVEGIDFSILSSFDFTLYKVPVWVVETCEYSENHIKPKIQTIIDLMVRSGYFVYADTYINTIFVHKDWFYNYRNEP